jgi:integrase
MTAPQGTSLKNGEIVVCSECGSTRLYRDGLRYLSEGEAVQRWLCRDCGYRFSERPLQKSPEWSINTPSALESNNQLCVLDKKAKKLDEAQELKTCAGLEKATEQTIKGEIVQFPLYCQKEGMQPSSVKTFSRSINRLSKIANLNDPEDVKEAISKLKIDENTKVSYCSAYDAFLRSIGKTWKPPKYRFTQKLPEFLPTEQEIDALIAGAGRKTGPLLQLIKETGLRLGEALSLNWMCINFETQTVVLTTAEKHSLPRVFKVSQKLLGMLGTLPRQNEKVFGKTTNVDAQSNLRQTRKKVAIRLANPRIAKIHYHLLRHWYGTMEYHKKPDIFSVSKLLGHRSVLSTQIYINLEKMIFSGTADDYIVKVVDTLEDAVKLMEVGFEFHTEIEGHKLFRKRK